MIAAERQTGQRCPEVVERNPLHGNALTHFIEPQALATVRKSLVLDGGYRLRFKTPVRWRPARNYFV